MRLSDLEWRREPSSYLERAFIGRYEIVRWARGCFRDDGTYDIGLIGANWPQHVSVDALTAQCLIYHLLGE